MKKIILMVCSLFLLTSCIDTYFTSNVPSNKIDLKVSLRRGNVAWYPDQSAVPIDNAHFHTNDHCHDQNDTCETSNSGQSYFHSLYMSFSLVTHDAKGVEHAVGLEKGDRVYAEVNGVRFRLTDNTLYYYSGKTKIADYSLLNASIDSRYHPEAFYQIADEAAPLPETDYENFTVRFFIERSNGSVLEAIFAYASNQEILLTETLLDGTTYELKAEAITPSIKHINISTYTFAAYQFAEFTVDSNGDYVTGHIAPYSDFNPYAGYSFNYDYDCIPFSMVAERLYDGQPSTQPLLMESAYTATTAIDKQHQLSDPEACSGPAPRYFVSFQNTEWNTVSSNFASIKYQATDANDAVQIN